MRDDEVVKLTSGCVDRADNIHFHTTQQHDRYVPQQTLIGTLHIEDILSLARLDTFK